MVNKCPGETMIKIKWKLKKSYNKQFTSGTVLLDFTEAWKHELLGISSVFSEVILMRSSKILVQSMLWLHLNVIASSVIDVPWNPVYETSLTWTADVCERKGNYINV